MPNINYSVPTPDTYAQILSQPLNIPCKNIASEEIVSLSVSTFDDPLIRVFLPLQTHRSNMAYLDEKMSPLEPDTKSPPTPFCRTLAYITAFVDHAAAFTLGFFGMAAFMFIACVTLNLFCQFWSTAVVHVDQTVLELLAMLDARSGASADSRMKMIGGGASWVHESVQSLYRIWCWSMQS